MNQSPTRTLSNVWISAGENRVQLVDVIFDDKIRQIIPKMKDTIEWNEIDTPEKLTRFRNQIDKSEDSISEKIQGAFLFMMPGAIDSHVHFNTPGFEDREDFEHGSFAAAYGGVTTIIDMPCTSLPPVTSLKNMENKLEILRGRSWVDYALWGGVSGTDFQNEKVLVKQISELAEAGVVGFKAYFISGMESFTDLTANQMMQVARWIALTGRPLAVHAEEKALVQDRQTLLQELGKNDWTAYCKSRDDRAEAGAVYKTACISQRSDCPVHIVHLSSELGLQHISQAREEGVRITTETCPHYLFFTQDDFDNSDISSYLKTAPPVKLASDRNALWQGLADGTIQFVTTDHAGCDPEKEKSSQNFWEVYGGIPGVEHRVPFLFSEGFLKNRLTLEQTVNLLSTNVAHYFGLYPKKGTLEVGSDADFTLLNLWKPFTVRASDMHSKGKYTPFEGIQFNASVEWTYLRGKLVYNRHGGPEVELGFGQWVKP